MMSVPRSARIWFASALVVTLVGLLWANGRAGRVQAERLALDQVRHEEQRLALAIGDVAAIAAQADALAKRQREELTSATAALLAVLPDGYRTDDPLAASARVRGDAQVLSQAFAARGIQVPGALPFAQGIQSTTPAMRRLDLASAHLVRQVLEHALAAGVARIIRIAPGAAWCDPSGTLAAIPVTCEVEADTTVMVALIRRFIAAHGSGLGLREIGLTLPSSADSATDSGAVVVHARMVATLLVTNEPHWGLRDDQGRMPVPPVDAGSLTTAERAP